LVRFDAPENHCPPNGARVKLGTVTETRGLDVNYWEVKMGWLSFIILGLIAGAIAKLILPGKQGGGWIATLILGVVGALLGGWLAGLIFNIGYDDFWSIQSWLIAIVGALVVLLIWGFATKGRAKA
jgi:Predicted membrane protein